jgi:CheY-like chemotaxis protein
MDAAQAKNYPGMIAGSYVLMTVTDNGHGMDAATQKRIFEPFFTTKATGKGTGLGLATVYGIIKQSGGYVFVDSEPGSGATFRIYLPQTLETAAAEGAEPSRSAPRGTESVLVVEDEQLVREFAAKVLERLGYHVRTVASPAEAIAYATQAGAHIDLIVSDVVLPEMSGPAMAAELRRRHIRPATIYMSGYTDDALIRDGAISGDYPILQKPFTADALAYAVRRALDAGDTDDALDAIPVSA